MACPICCEENNDESLYKLDCDDEYCCTCLATYLRNSINESKYEIKCPKNDCQFDIPYKIIDMLLDASYMSRLDRNILRNTVMTSDDMVFCPDCDVINVDKYMMEMNIYVILIKY